MHSGNSTYRSVNAGFFSPLARHGDVLSGSPHRDRRVCPIAQSKGIAMPWRRATSSARKAGKAVKPVQTGSKGVFTDDEASALFALCPAAGVERCYESGNERDSSRGFPVVPIGA